MRRQGKKIAASGVALAVACLALSPAFSAVSDLVRVRAQHAVSLNDLGSLSSFTPATRDSRLAQAYARIAAAGGSRGIFRFTPTSGSMSGSRSITIAVRTDAAIDSDPGASASPGTPAITPLSFSLGTARGWKSFALADSVGARPIETPPIQTLNKLNGFVLPAKESRTKVTGEVASERAVGTAPVTLAGEKVMSVDLASSYKLTRNLNVTAGVRYKGPNARLTPLTDAKQDSQAVYVGTQFKF
jgi:hypothetical protein